MLDGCEAAQMSSRILSRGKSAYQGPNCRPWRSPSRCICCATLLVWAQGEVFRQQISPVWKITWLLECSASDLQISLRIGLSIPTESNLLDQGSKLFTASYPARRSLLWVLSTNCYDVRNLGCQAVDRACMFCGPSPNLTDSGGHPSP